MRRALLLALVLAFLVARAACVTPRPVAVLVVEGGADAVGARVTLDGRDAGTLQAVGALAALEARGPIERWSDVAVTNTAGVRLTIRAALGESTLVRVSFADRRIAWMPMSARATAAEDDSLASEDD